MPRLPCSRLTAPTLVAMAGIALAIFAPRADAYSFGAPICEVNVLPLVEMSPTLASPAPTGWSLHIADRRYIPGKPLRVAVTNSDPARRARGVLLWAKAGPSEGLGAFTVDNDVFQSIPSGFADCGEWAATHVTALPKTLDQLQLDWTAPTGSTETVLFRAFIIEECGQPGGCRAYQALTPVVLKQAGLFVDEFEQ